MADFLWTIYLGLLATASLAFLIKGKYKTKLSKIDFVVSIIPWIGLFGYVTETAILNPAAWKIIGVAAFVWDLTFTMLLKGYEGEEILDEMPVLARRIWMLATFAVMVGPLYYGLFRYAFG
ncbi:hypothetical protein [Mesobacillus foraminis]|uniref:Uncharacterized protein n=1 Tax=Mesobacillus foraminis TaxID=279826 RepID=A0A4R2B2Z8_9BACI|nr:hypothetical protein [Mesobacillus foraminis]TCN20425.1 hypothetical protein EV146_11443 [Mesobacillus foraminis]